jgi:hypothetical protein
MAHGQWTEVEREEVLSSETIDWERACKCGVKDVVHCLLLERRSWPRKRLCRS